MRAALIALLCAGCGQLLGIDDVTLAPDASLVDAPAADRPADAAPDAPIDAPMPMPDAEIDGSTCTISGPCQPANPCHVGQLECVSGQSVCMDTGVAVTNGMPCNDADACTRTDSCQAGVCVGANPVVCQASDQCHVAGTCDPATGVCSNPNQQNGTGCDDGNACTSGESCQNGVCGSPATTVTCQPLDQCHDAGTCDPGTGACSNPNKQNGTGCNDGSACTTGETCQNGVCGSPTSTVTCSALDQCHVAGTCNPATGVCTNPLAGNGTQCDDGRACTTGDSCQAGLCVPSVNACNCGSDADCPALDQCHLAGTCNVSTGVCSNPIKSNGTACNDGNACTSGETCQNGSCGAPMSTVSCSALDQCHVAGTCDPATGVCSNPAKSNGTACNDASACTSGETCQNGACGSPTSVTTCSAIDQCHVAGACDPATGVCSNPNKSNGTACDDGTACTSGETCQNGVCGSPTSTVSCSALDQCHIAGTCDPASGVCTNPNKSNGSTCDDGTACTGGETCQNGVCGSPTSTITCSALDQCHVAGTCNPSTGVCSNPNKSNGTACDDASLCTTGESCQNGVCGSPTSTVTCTALDSCHDVGTCSPSTGVCSNPVKSDGSSCGTGVVCMSGTCVCTVQSCASGCCQGNTCQAGTQTSACGSGGNSCQSCSTPSNSMATCSGGNCGYSCNSGFHDCGGGLCASDTDATHCGPSCQNCPTPAHSMATCNGSCGFTCLSGYHLCNGACVDNNSPATCGPTSCNSPCPTDPNGVATCNGTSCGISCNSSYNLCAGNVCRHCCSAADCPSDPNSSGVICNASGNCVYSCLSCYHQCGNACVSNTATTSCGTSSCTMCPQPPNATATCSGGTCNSAACGFTCNAGFVLDGLGGCTPAPPRLVAPLSTAFTTQQRPTFKVQLAPNTDGASMRLCADRACTNPSTQLFSLTAAGGYASGQPPSALQPGIYFWSAVGKVGTTVGTKSSTIWQVVIPRANGGTVDTSYGSYPDFNADGQSDLVMVDSASNMYVYNGAAAAWPASQSYIVSHWGATPIAAAGDINGDGYPELTASAFFQSGGGYTQAFVIPGTSTGPSNTTEYAVGLGPGVNYGDLAAGIGDMDGDGYGDIAALNQSGTPTLTIYRGGPSGLTQSAQFTVTLPNNPAGCSVVTIRAVAGGDFNGDGYGDVAIAGHGIDTCAPVRSIGTNAWIYLGGAGGITSNTPAIQLTVAPYPAPGYIGFGRDMAVGDVNGDGYADVVIGARDESIFYTAGAYVYLGGPTLTGPLPIAQQLSFPAGSFIFDIGLAVGDFTGDGVADLVVADNYSGFAYGFFGQAGMGLPTAGTPTTPNWSVNLGGFVGTGIANAGDVNGDGFMDVVVGTTNGNNTNIGRAFLYYGQNGAINTTAAQTIMSTDPGLGTGVACWMPQAPVARQSTQQ